MATTGFATGAYSAAQQLIKARGGAGAPGGLGAFGGLGGSPAAGGSSFGQMLTNALDGVAASGRKAETQAMSAASGKANLVDVVTAVAESETALQTLVAVRDRVISAYEEIMRMPI